MKRLFALFLLLISVVCMASAKKVEEQQRVVKSFSKIRNESPVDIHFIQRNYYKVAVTALPADQQRIVCETTPDGILVIRLAEHVKGFSGLPAMEIVAPRLDFYEGTGSGSFFVDGQVEFFDFKVHLTGSGNTRIDTVYCKHLSLITEDNGDIKVKKAVVRGDKEYVSHGRGKVMVNGKLQKDEQEEGKKKKK